MPAPVRALRHDGRSACVGFLMPPFRGGDGAILGIAAILRDLPERVSVRGAHLHWMTP